MKTLKDTKLSMLDLVAIREGRSVADALAVALSNRPPGRIPRLHPLLGGRAPQHARHRQLGHRRAGGPHRRRHRAHPRRIGRHHAAQPCPAGGRRSLRHPRRALPRPDRPGPRPAPPGTDGVTMRALRRDRAESEDELPPRSGRTAAAPRPRPSPASGVVAVPGAGTNVPILDPRLQPGSRPASPQSAACPTPSRRTSPRASCSRPSPCTAASSSRRRCSTSPT